MLETLVLTVLFKLLAFQRYFKFSDKTFSSQLQSLLTNFTRIVIIIIIIIMVIISWYYFLFRVQIAEQISAGNKTKQKAHK